MEKIKTGIKGFDGLLGGGFPIGRSILIGGTPGTGKTIFALQFLYNGATTFKEKGLYVTLEETSDSLRKQANQFGWDLAKLEKEGKIKILDIGARDVKESTANEIVKLVKKNNYKRLVIDSMSALAINTPNTFGAVSEITELFVKRFMYHFIHDLNGSGATSLLISQTVDGSLSSDSVSEFICDGVINIRYESLGGDYSRHLTVRKMRQVKNDEDVHPMEIGKKGIVVHTLN
ncbi:MAG: AAA family ATPase [bacterium]|nr:AAA family ATPase [bacterium]